MNYVFQFGDIWSARGELLQGTLVTLRLTAEAMVIGMIIAVVGAFAITNGPKVLRVILKGYVEFMRNTPFLVQLFVIFFGLPTIGLRLTPNGAALLAMSLNVGAYTIEIVRAGIESIGKGQIEGAKSLGLRTWQTFLLVVFPQAIKAVYSPLGSQFILLMLGSSVVSSIAAEDLTATANVIGERTFRTFEIYLVVAGIYFALSLLISGLFNASYRWMFGKQEKR